MGVCFSLFLEDDHATTHLGARLARLLRSGDTVLLKGEIGTGKTHLARSIIKARFRAEGLAVVDVPSPTYTLVQTYDLKALRIWHADLYRLGDPSEVAELGLEDALSKDITLIEWPDKLASIPTGALTIILTPASAGRRAKFTSDADRWKDMEKIIEIADET